MKLAVLAWRAWNSTHTLELGNSIDDCLTLGSCPAALLLAPFSRISAQAAAHPSALLSALASALVMRQSPVGGSISSTDCSQSALACCAWCNTLSLTPDRKLSHRSSTRWRSLNHSTVLWIGYSNLVLAPAIALQGRDVAVLD